MDLILIILSLIGLLFFTRITKKPARAYFNAVEASANTYVEVDIELPLTILADNKVLAAEFLKWKADLIMPDPEPGQDNLTQVQIVRDSQTGILTRDDEDNLIDVVTSEVRSEDVNSNDLNFNLQQRDFDRSLRDADDDGEMVIESKIHVGISGTGNSGTKSAKGYIEYHLVELSAAEVGALWIIKKSSE